MPISKQSNQLRRYSTIFTMYGLQNCFIINRLISQIPKITLVSAARSFCIVGTPSQPPEPPQPPPAEIIQAVKENAQLAKFGLKTVCQVYDIFMEQGFDTTGALKIIKDNPLVLRYRPESVYKRIEIWRGCQFGGRLAHELIKQCPELLDFDDEEYVRGRVADLTVYAATKKNVWRLLMASPNLLIDNLPIFTAKCNYLDGIMKVDVTDAVKSGVFAYSLRRIRTRHMFMVRLGIYKERTKHYNEMDTDKNPRMRRIMDSSDEKFAKKVCGVSLLEYETFVELYRRELKNNKQLTGDYRIDNVEEEDEVEDSDYDDEELDVDDDPDYLKDYE